MKTDDAGKCCPYLFAARTDRFIDDIQEAGVMDTAENIENPIVRNGWLMTVWIRVVEDEDCRRSEFVGSCDLRRGRS